ncbi:MAG: hypothetical protein QGG64_08040, partial [Candidatus Latescibacteria bacterium]|nr:hypothetical protein [Candidatus Latescibacterota bacterium]
MSEQPTQRNFSRRKALAGIGASGVVLAQYTTRALAQEASMQTDQNINLTRYPTVQAMKAQLTPQEGEWAET